ncbi:TRAP transporter small permease subunit [uncultured Maritimibacter sp.]|jgi:TRAP-type mannitol/chloroaromatic compound transport system permease small subunit|uniref:TRAP transporter small permease subunit n=1 Tax=uncultured Maritimibacter sp. TaxID=991866 RepID=UPI000A44588F|nr:TRAP transporter small permease subunit [uncultured Maritimibacter sp.]
MSLSSQALRLLDRATQGANVIGTLLIAGLVVLICVDVVGREAFGAPLKGVPEMIALSIVAIVFLQVPQALRAGRLTRSDGVINVLHRRKPRLAALLETVFEVLGFAVVATILYAHWPLLVKAYTRGDFVGSTGNLTIPTWPVKAMILVGCVLLGLQFLARIARRFKGEPVE